MTADSAALPSRAPEAPPEPRLRLTAYPFHCRVETRFADLDPLRHVNNVSMGTLFEEGRLQFHHAHLGRMGPPPDGEGFKLVVVQIGMRFLAETFYPGTVEIGLGVTRLGRSSFHYGQGLFQGGRCTALCDITLVAVRKGASHPLPDGFRAGLSTFLIDLT